jgi:uncharacterized protein YjcR
MKCKQPGCEHEATAKAKASFCTMHKQRLRLAKELAFTSDKIDDFMSALLSNNEIWSRLTDAALDYADADSEDDKAYQRACNRLRMAARVYSDTRQGK